MKKSIILLFLVILIAAATLFSFWCGRQVCHAISGQKNLYAGMNLTSEQQEKLKGIDAAFMKEADSVCMNVCRERVNLMNLVSAAQSDPALIHQKIDEIGSLQISLEKKVADHILEVKKTLTLQQSETYLKHLNEELAKSMQQCGYGQALKS